MAPRRSAAMPRAISLIQRGGDIAAPRNYLAETREYLVNAGIVARNPRVARRTYRRGYYGGAYYGARSYYGAPRYGCRCY